MEDKLYEVYETFIEILMNHGWKNRKYGWKEIVRSEVDEWGWALFEYDNGFRLKLTYPNQNQKEAILQYWFVDNPEMINVETLEQLLRLMN